ncbi:MAG: YggU family protein [SAR324 cluster bacterium]|nr:YggU family protein [SAR324 cluster bacterium]
MTQTPFHWNEKTLTLHLHIQPGASRNRWQGFYQDQIKLSIAAPPVEGQANKKCIEFLAKSFHVAKSDVTILRGENNRSKLIQIHNADPEIWKSILNTFKPS